MRVRKERKGGLVMLSNVLDLLVTDLFAQNWKVEDHKEGRVSQCHCSNWKLENPKSVN